MGQVVANSSGSRVASRRKAAGGPSSKATGEPSTHARESRLPAWFSHAFERIAGLTTKGLVARIRKRRAAIVRDLEGVPARMQRLTNQAQLVLELLEDFNAGRYHLEHWYSLPVAAAGLLYFVSPTDLVPDVVPVVGLLDDVAAMALSLRVLRRELDAYVRFKHLDPAQYFD